MKKIFSILLIFSILFTTFCFGVSAETIAETSNDFTIQITKVDTVYKYSNVIPNGFAYYNQNIPSNTYNSWNNDPYSVFEDLCVCDYMSVKMYVPTNDFQISVDVGGIFEAGLSFYMSALTGDPSSGFPPAYASGHMPINMENPYDIATPYARAYLTNETGSLEYYVDFDCITNPNNAFVTWSKTSWRNVSGEKLYVQYFEFGCTPSVGTDPIFFFNSRCLELLYRLYSPNQAMVNDLTSSFNDNAERTQEVVRETVEQATEQITNGWTPDPETPQGAEDFEALDSVESQLNDFANENLDSIDMLNDDLSNALSGHLDAFKLFIGIFDKMYNVGWFRLIISVALAFGIISFILNIWPTAVNSVIRKRREAQQRKQQQQQQQKQKQSKK